MDVKLKNGDMVLDGMGNPVYIDGVQEKFQQALFCINTRKGSFRYNKNMGFDAVTSVLTEKDRENLHAKLLEAVACIEGMDVYVNSAEELIDGEIKADISLFFEGEELEAEVILNGKL